MLKTGWDTARLQGAIFNTNQAWTNGAKHIFKNGS